MKFSFRPKTCYGKLSVKFLVAFLSSYVLSVILVALTLRQAGDVLSLDPSFSPVIGVAGILALISGISAFGTGLFSIIKEKERSILTSASVFIGVLVLLSLLGEIVIPH